MLTRIVLLLILVLALTAGCGGGEPGRERVVAAFYPLAFAAEAIGEGALDVVNLTPPGAEPHDLELTARQVADVRDARLVAYLGGGFQPALERALRDRAGTSLDLLAGAHLMSAPGGDASRRDPHVWLDPRRFAGIVRALGEALGRRASGERLAGRLEALDAELAAGLARCERREIVTSHAAFAYLAERYDLEQVSLTGLAPGSEPGPRALAALVEAVRARGATTVFSEPLTSPALAQTIAREAGVSAAVLDPLEGLTSKQVASGDDYFSVMRANLAALRRALSCR